MTILVSIGLKQTVLIYHLSSLRVSNIKNWTLWHLSNDFLTIIHDHAGCSLTRNRKQEEMSDFWPKSDLGHLRTLSSDTREFLKQYVFDWEAKQLFRKWSPTGAGRHERVVYWLKWHWHYGSVCQLSVNIWIVTMSFMLICWIFQAFKTLHKTLNRNITTALAARPLAPGGSW